MAGLVPKLNLGDGELMPPSPVAGNSVNGLTMNTDGLRVSQEQRRLHYLYQEFSAIYKDPIEGVYVSPSSRNLLEWFGVLIVRAGIYCGGMFRFTLTIPNDFPDTKTMPAVKFHEHLFHPLINSKTDVTDLSRYFPSGWQRDRNHIYQILAAVQGMFFRCEMDASQATNPEAAILIAHDRQKFKQLAREAVRRSRTQIYDVLNTDDENAISFTPWNETEMEPFRKFLIGKINIDRLVEVVPRTRCVQTLLEAHNKKAGFSWVNADHCQYMCDLLPMPKPNRPEELNIKAVTENSNNAPSLSSHSSEVFGC